MHVMNLVLVRFLIPFLVLKFCSTKCSLDNFLVNVYILSMTFKLQ
uniref:Uncharacterized protein n=1 Tax=Rhizophora mucronata TaxID=61149 RepID=A0A2P2NCL9_RHIMU